MTSRLFLTLVCVVVSIFDGVCQSAKIDSLVARFESFNPADSHYVDVGYKLAQAFYAYSVDSSQVYINKALAAAEKINYQKGIVEGCNLKGIVAFSLGEYEEALAHYKRYMRFAIELGDSSSLEVAYFNIALVHQNVGEYDEAILYLERSIELCVKLEDEAIGKNLNVLGLAYMRLGEYPKAISCFTRSLASHKVYDKSQAEIHRSFAQLFMKLQDFEQARKHLSMALEEDIADSVMRGVALDYFHFGELYQELDSSKIALDYLLKSLEIHEIRKDKTIIADIKNQIGLVYMGDDLPTALVVFKQALEIKALIGDDRGVVESSINIAKVYLELHQLDSAEHYAQNGLLLASSIGTKSQLSSIHELLYTIYRQQGNYKQSLDYLLSHHLYEDSLINESKVREIAQLEARHELEQVNASNRILKKENQLNRTVLIAAFSSLLLMLLLVLVLMRRYTDKKRSARELTQLNNELTLQRDMVTRQAAKLKEVNERVVDINTSLEKTVEDRTEKIQMQDAKLRRYAFSNAHLLRAPLARILGLIYAKEHYRDDLTKGQEYDELIVESALELDGVVRDISALLSDQESEAGSQLV